MLLSRGNQERIADTCAAVFWSLLEENPHLVDLWQSYAMCLVGTGRTDEAIAAAKRGLDYASPGAKPLFLRLLGELYLRRGNVGEALRHTQLAIEMGEPAASRRCRSRVVDRPERTGIIALRDVAAQD